MANRFIDTSFFKSPFVRSLKGPLKGLYVFIICDCNGSGIWSADFQAASLYTGFELTQKDFEENFIKKGKAICLENGKYFMPDFIEHQYPNGLSYTNPAQKNFIAELLKYSLVDEDLKVLECPFEGSKVMVMEKVMVEVEEKVAVKKPKNPEKKLELIFPYSSELFLNSWQNLLTLSKWKNKDPVSLQASLKKLSKYPEEEAIEMIENTITGNWQGIFELEKYKNGNSKHKSSNELKSSAAQLGNAAREHLRKIENGNNAPGNTG